MTNTNPQKTNQNYLSITLYGILAILKYVSNLTANGDRLGANGPLPAWCKITVHFG